MLYPWVPTPSSPAEPLRGLGNPMSPPDTPVLVLPCWPPLQRPLIAAQGQEPVASAGTHMGISGRARSDGTSQGCRDPGCCPNMVLHFVSPPELFRLHCSWEETEEWAAPQIVSVLWDGCGGLRVPTSEPCRPMGGGSGWAEPYSLTWPRYLPPQDHRLWWGRFLLLLGK